MTVWFCLFDRCKFNSFKKICWEESILAALLVPNAVGQVWKCFPVKESPRVWCGPFSWIQDVLYGCLVGWFFFFSSFFFLAIKFADHKWLTAKTKHVYSYIFISRGFLDGNLFRSSGTCRASYAEALSCYPAVVCTVFDRCEHNYVCKSTKFIMMVVEILHLCYNVIVFSWFTQRQGIRP